LWSHCIPAFGAWCFDRNVKGVHGFKSLNVSDNDI
jgi:hypothetical protein